MNVVNSSNTNSKKVEELYGSVDSDGACLSSLLYPLMLCFSPPLTVLFQFGELGCLHRISTFSPLSVSF